jgi:hypothetical protein
LPKAARRQRLGDLRSSPAEEQEVIELTVTAVSPHEHDHKATLVIDGDSDRICLAGVATRPNLVHARFTVTYSYRDDKSHSHIGPRYSLSGRRARAFFLDGRPVVFGDPWLARAPPMQSRPSHICFAVSALSLSRTVSSSLSLSLAPRATCVRGYAARGVLRARFAIPPTVAALRSSSVP